MTQIVITLPEHDRDPDLRARLEGAVGSNADIQVLPSSQMAVIQDDTWLTERDLAGFLMMNVPHCEGADAMAKEFFDAFMRSNEILAPTSLELIVQGSTRSVARSSVKALATDLVALNIWAPDNLASNAELLQQWARSL